MKGLAKKLENLMMAVAFAEAGEHETARAIMKEGEHPAKKDRVRPDKTMRASSSSRRP